MSVQTNFRAVDMLGGATPTPVVVDKPVVLEKKAKPAKVSAPVIAESVAVVEEAPVVVEEVPAVVEEAPVVADAE